MSIVKCSNRHFFDDEKFEKCPHCIEDEKLSSDGGVFEQESIFNEQRTRAIIYEEELKRKISSFTQSADDEKTVALFSKKRGYDPVVGWLVCKAGLEKGRDYRLHSGRNFVGRAYEMDIVIRDDPQISRKNHCSIIYDPINEAFFISPGEGTVTYLNGALLEKSKNLYDDYEISLGSITLVFIAFCRGDRKW